MVEAGEFRHLVQVRRLSAGSAVELFDGAGHSADAVIERVTGHRALLRVRSVVSHPRRRPLLHLASALPKGDRMATLIDMATQLGMDVFTPLACERSVVRWSAAAARRAGQVAIEAGKQCGRAWLPRIEDETRPAELVERAPLHAALVCDADGDGWQALAGEAFTGAAEIVLLVGPEGGFSAPERQLFAQKGLGRLRLSCTVLRIETAAAVAVALARLVGAASTIGPDGASSATPAVLPGSGSV